jgi:sarcosine oxidase
VPWLDKDRFRFACQAARLGSSSVGRPTTTPKTLTRCTLHKQSQGRGRYGSPIFDHTAACVNHNPHSGTYAVGVIGLGAMGSAATLAIASRGARVIAFDAASPPHALGSTHGHTRIIREAYYEHPLYVPLVQRAYELWAELERAAETSLLIQTGGVMVGQAESALFRGALESARTHGIPHEVLDAAGLTERFPAYRARPDWLALFEKRAGMLLPERCVAAAIEQAARAGADVRTNERVLGWKANGRTSRLTTTKGSYDVERIVVAAGPWLTQLRESLGVDLPVEIERQLSHWFDPVRDEGRYRAPACPIGLWEASNGEVFATLPDEGHGVKCGMHHAGSMTGPESVDRIVTEEENAAARRLLNEVMPGAGGRLRESRVCLYTNTPDRHFIIDWLERERVLVLSPCSGHGFKFASAIGEIASQLVLDGRCWLDLAPFALSRFR